MFCGLCKSEISVNDDDDDYRQAAGTLPIDPDFSYFLQFLKFNFAFCWMCFVKVKDEIQKLVTADKRTQYPRYESYLNKKMFFFPGIPPA